MKDRRFVLIACTLCVVSTFMFNLVMSARADQDPKTDTVPRRIPYHGVLELDGKAITGTMTLEFELFDGCDAAAPQVYIERATIELHAGRFSVLLGPTGSGGEQLSEVIAGADELCLGTTIVPETGDPVPLVGRKLLVPMPYALWATDASSFRVAKDLGVGLDPATQPTMAPLHLANNVSPTAGFTSFSDYQTLLYQSAGADTSYGMGIEGGTFAFNTGADYKFYRGSALDLHVAAGNTIVKNNLTVEGTITNLQVSGDYTAQRNNTEGTSSTTMRSTTRSLCFLTRVAFEDLDSGGEVGECRVTTSGSNWVLQARVGPGGDPDAWCMARCLYW